MFQSIVTNQYTVNSLDEFVGSLPGRENYSNNHLFRGHQDAEWELRPSIFRIRKEPMYKSWKGFEKALLERFKKQALPFINTIPPRDVDWLALGQHHGLPTRLLDWTENPLIALYFSVKDSGLNKDSAVWAGNFKYTSHTVKNIDKIFADAIIYQPAVTTPRIIAQRGWFSVHNFPESNETFVPLEKRALLPTSTIKYLVKFTIPVDKRDLIKKELDKVGIDYFLIYPDLDGLCKQIWWDLERSDTTRLGKEDNSKQAESPPLPPNATLEGQEA